MLEVDIDKILPLTEARDNFNKIIDDVEGTEKMYVLTKNGKPSAVIVGVNHLEKLTGKTADELTSIVEKKADETPVVEEVTPNTPSDNVGAPISPTEASVDGSKPATTTDVSATRQSILPGNETPSPFDLPVDNQVSSPTESVEAPMPQAAPASTAPSAVPTSSPGSAGDNIASNQAPAAAPTENGAAANDSDLFV